MRICLILEGSYPYTHGGVSSWMHHYIEAMPDTDFVLWVIGAHQKDRGHYVVTLPKNVVEIHELFLDEILSIRMERSVRYRFTKEEEEALLRLLDCDHPDWKILFHLYQKKNLHPGAFLSSPTFLHKLTKLCHEKYPNVAFADLFHTTRSMILPVLYLMGSPVPEADIYHSICTGYGGLLGSMAHYITGKPMILTEHGIYSREREEEIIRAQWVLPSFKPMWIRFFYMLSEASYHAASGITSLFHRAMETQVELGADPNLCRVIGNGINVERFSGIPMKVPDDFIDIGAVVRIAPIKDIKTLLYAFHELKSRMSNVRLHILGDVDDEEYAQECRTLMKSLELRDVIFTGQVDVRSYMEKLDFTILTSISEGQPLSVLESLAAGRPAVTTDVGCCRELLEGGPDDPFGPAGFCVPPMNRRLLADAMEKMCRDPETRRRFAENGRKRCHAFFQHKQMMQHYQTLYQEILREGNYGRNRL